MPYLDGVSRRRNWLVVTLLGLFALSIIWFVVAVALGSDSNGVAPMLPLTLGGVLWVGVAWAIEWPLRRRLRRAGGALCPGCGYDLVDRPSAICPECGLRISAEEAVDAWGRLRSRWPGDFEGRVESGRDEPPRGGRLGRARAGGTGRRGS
jgi:hypothetical protein